MKEMKAENNNKGSRKSTSHGRPQSILMQKVSSDQEAGNSASGKKSSSSSKSKKQLKLEEERQQLEKEKAEFENWKKRFWN